MPIRSTETASGRAAAPAAAPSAVVGMAIFLATEAMFFAALISAFWVLRSQASDWPPPDQPRLPAAATAVNTAALLASGWTLQRAFAQRRRGGRDEFAFWLFATAGLGAFFAAAQGAEWVRLVRFGLTASSSLYGATFYLIVGAHGFHVLAGLALLLALVVRARRPSPGLGAPERMYWLFVVGLWPLLYTLVYLA
jgi:heme/copper-type cytochrome/quinol oxidase subunit 3